MLLAVSAGFDCSIVLTSLSLAVNPAGRSQVDLLGRRLTDLARVQLCPPGQRMSTLFLGIAASADQITTKGIVIRDASVSFQDVGTALLPPGTTFTVINNTAATPITATFSNLADGAIITIGSNAFQASYEGGDGNDLTLIVVP